MTIEVLMLLLVAAFILGWCSWLSAYLLVERIRKRGQKHE